MTPVGQTAALNTVAFVNGGDSGPRSRPSLAQAFSVNATGAVFIVDVNHLKSKGSACDAPDAGDGQGNCNQVRVNAATELMAWLASDPTGTGDPDVLLVGDYNAYAREDPITAIRSAGFTNLDRVVPRSRRLLVRVRRPVGLRSTTRSRLRRSSARSPASAMITSTPTSPSVLDYNTDFKTANLQATLYAPDQFRVSDHDPVVVGLSPNAAPTVSGGGPYSVSEGASITLSASGSDPNGDGLAYAWDLDDDGSFETPGQNVTFSAALLDGPGTASVAVRATDAGGLSAEVPVTVTITNAAPAVGLPVVTAEPSQLGGAAVAAASFSDPGPDAPFTCTVDYGDGSGSSAGTVAGGTCTGQGHTYSAIGNYTVTVSVTDKDGAAGIRELHARRRLPVLRVLRAREQSAGAEPGQGRPGDSGEVLPGRQPRSEHLRGGVSGVRAITVRVQRRGRGRHRRNGQRPAKWPVVQSGERAIRLRLEDREGVGEHLPAAGRDVRRRHHAAGELPVQEVVASDRFPGETPASSPFCGRN